MFLAVTKDHYENFILPMTKKEIDNPAIKTEKVFYGDPEINFAADGVLEGVVKVYGTLGAWYGTTYEQIIKDVKSLENNDKVERIVFEINSPGGYVNGIIEAAEVIKNCQKETIAKVGYIAASGAYWLASQCDQIIATTKIAIFGSIGVIVSFYDWKAYLEKAGIKEIIITSTDAPNKYLDPASKEGGKEILDRLDKIHNEFAETVAFGRNKSISYVNDNFGKGGVLFAEEAENVGMIDKIRINNKLEVSEMAAKEEKVFTEEELNSKIKEAVEASNEAQKKEFLKHLNYAERANKETIVANVTDGKPFSDCVEAYLEEDYAKKEVEAKHEENSPEDHAAEGDGEKTEEERKKADHSAKFKEECKKEGIEID